MVSGDGSRERGAGSRRTGSREQGAGSRGSAPRSWLPAPCNYGIGASFRGNISSRMAKLYAVAATTTAACIRSSISM